MTQETAKRKAPVKKERSPSYPGIPLREALDRARQVYEHERRNWAPKAAVFKHWNYSTKASPGLITFAALRKFGLLQAEGSGQTRKAKLTDLALRIITDHREDSTERMAAIQEAALAPPIHSELWEKYEGALPSDASLKYELLNERHFTETGAAEFIKEYRDTIDFAGLAEVAPDKKRDRDTDKPNPSLQPKEPEKMAGMREDVFNLDEGQVVLRWPATLSQESFEDFKSWIDLVIRRAKRAVRTADNGSEAQETDAED